VRLSVAVSVAVSSAVAVFALYPLDPSKLGPEQSFRVILVTLLSETTLAASGTCLQKRRSSTDTTTLKSVSVDSHFPPF